MLTEPRFQAFEAELLAFVKLPQELPGLKVIEFETQAVHAQERGGSRDGCALVAIDEGAILGKAFEQGRSLFDDVLVVPGAWPGQSRFQGPRSRRPGAPPNRAMSRA